MDGVKLKKIDWLKMLLRLICISLIIAAISIFVTSFKMGINNHDFILNGKTFFTEDTTMIYEFKNDGGQFTHYILDEVTKESNVDSIKIFNYEIKVDEYIVNLTFNDNTTQEFYFIKDALFNSVDNIYLYELI